MRIALGFEPGRLAQWQRLLEPHSGGHQLMPCESLEALAALDPQVIVGHQLPFVISYASSNPAGLQWLHMMTTGVDHLVPALRSSNSGVRVSNVRGINAEAMREYVAAMLLYLTKDMRRLMEESRDKVWSPSVLATVAGKTVTIVGVGGVGKAVAEICHALSLRVVGVGRSARPLAGFYEVHGPSGLHAALGVADIVVICAPLTEQTSGLFDAAAFTAMRPGAMLINVARGEIVDEQALLAALASGHLGGAALDAFAEEPLPRTSPLWSAPNLIITPHIAGRFHDGHRRAAELFGANLRAFTSDGSLVTEVLLERGY